MEILSLYNIFYKKNIVDFERVHSMSGNKLEIYVHHICMRYQIARKGFQINL